MVAAPDGHRPVLEASNGIPLLWLALLDAAAPEAAWSAGATLRLADGPAVGVTFEREAALRRLAARRAGVVAWVGEAAGSVLDQLTDFLADQPGSVLRLDLSEWVELFDSREQALQSLRAGVAALDSKVGKRRPPAVRKLLDESGLSGREAQEPAFGVLLAGAACSGREPWRRDPPRERRAAEDYVTWSRQSDRHFISADGRMAATTVTNPAGVETPVMCIPGSSEVVAWASEVPDEVGYLYPQRLSADGGSLFCGVRWHPGAQSRTLRFGPDGVRVIHEGEPSFGVSACSAAGDVAAGALQPASGGPSRAAVWRDGSGVQVLPDVAPDSAVEFASVDGQVLAGSVRRADAAGQYCGAQVWIWRSDGSAGRCIAEAWRAEWQALSTDGLRGVIRLHADRAAPARLLWWDNAAAALLPIDCGAANPSDLVFSPDVRCALARTADALVLWWCDGRAVETTMATEGLAVDPRQVSSAGDWWVATARNTANHAVAAVLVWERGCGVQRFEAPPSDARLGLGLFVASRCESLEELVLLGQWRDSGEPVTWSLQRGFLAWGAAPRPLPAAPIDFTPLARAQGFAYLEMPARQRPMRVDVDRVGIGSRSVGFQAKCVPTFVVLDDDGRATDRVIDGGAWDATTEANVVAALTPWLG